MTTSRRPGKKAYLLITLFAFLRAFPVPLLVLHLVRPQAFRLGYRSYFANAAKPRRTQHALVQIGERITRRQNVSRWYPDVIQQSASPSVELRQTAAWIMGQDRNYAPFHDTLLRLIHDPEPMVRRNAALSLASFGDHAGRAELAAMLRPYTVTSPAGGAVKYRMKPGDYVNPGTMIGRVGETEVRAPVPGETRALDRNENAVQPGDPLVTLAPDKNHVWEALRALYVVGEPDDIPDVERYLRPVDGTAGDLHPPGGAHRAIHPFARTVRPTSTTIAAMPAEDRETCDIMRKSALAPSERLFEKVPSASDIILIRLSRARFPDSLYRIERVGLERRTPAFRTGRSRSRTAVPIFQSAPPRRPPAFT